MKSKHGLLYGWALVLLMQSCTKGTGQEGNGNPDGSGNNAFEKNVLIMEFVSFDCVYCPAVEVALKETNTTKYPGRLDIISVHGRLDEVDPMEFKNYKQLQNYFYGVTGYPAVIIDQRDDLVSVGEFSADNAGFKERINMRSNIGIALSAAIAEGRQVKVDVQLQNKAAASSDYRLAVAVLENNIPYKQADQVNGQLKWIDEYSHQHVLRAILSNNLFGDPLNAFSGDNVFTKSFTYNVPERYKLEDLSFVAYVIEAYGFAHRVVMNSRSVDVGHSVDFEGRVQ